MTTAQVVETSVTNNSLSQGYFHPDDHTKHITDTPGFKPFTKSHTVFRCLVPRSLDCQWFLLPTQTPRYVSIKIQWNLPYAIISLKRPPYQNPDCFLRQSNCYYSAISRKGPPLMLGLGDRLRGVSLMAIWLTEETVEIFVRLPLKRGGGSGRFHCTKSCNFYLRADCSFAGREIEKGSALIQDGASV